MVLFCLYNSVVVPVMAAAGLMDKLMKSGAVEERGGMLTFTSRFAGYLIWTVGTGQMLDTTIGDWQNVLTIFNTSLALLSQDEISDAVLLFNYYLDHPDMPTIEN